MIKPIAISTTRYFGVVTEREYIKIEGKRVPFWHFLDRLPDGWLTSLAYRRVEMPNDRLQIWDCGAWSYRNKPEPVLRGQEVTPRWALDRYVERAHQGAFVIAPDHMLIKGPGVDIEARRDFNVRSARAFLPLALDAGFRPVAVAHGMALQEWLDAARSLLDLGYDAVAVGGVAARAAKRREVVEIVQALREETEGAWLHVLGLSAPPYMETWHRLEVNSCDGSSHFKQAFTGGIYYTHEEGQLTRHKAARVDESGQLLGPRPQHVCDCRACIELMRLGIDTGQFGSNEHNMGRAAHNLNMLMRAHAWITRPQVHLVACVGQKAASPAPAADLYESTWFKKARAYVELHGGPWYILSAEHGILEPQQPIAPYDRSLNGMPPAERAAWGQAVVAELARRHAVPTRFVVLGGETYRRPLSALRALGHAVEAPLQGLGIGEQLAWLNRHNASQLSLFERPTRAV